MAGSKRSIFSTILIAVTIIFAFGQSVSVAAADGIPIVEPDGTTIGTIQVDSWSDTGSAANSAGTCCALGTATLTVTIAAANKKMSVDLATFWAFDAANLKAVAKMSDGGTAASGTVDIPAGESKSLTLIFLYQSLDVTDSGTLIQRVVWQRSASNLITLISDIDPIPPSTDVIVQANDLQALGVFRVDTFVDPLTGIRKSSQPPDGFRAIGLTLTVTVDPAGSISLTSDDFILVDMDGQIYTSIDTIKRLNSEKHGVPELASTTVLDPGETWDGFLAYQVPEDAVITDVYFKSVPSSSGGNLQPVMHIEFAD